MPLTETTVRNAKPRERLYKLSDGGGLQLHVTAAGARLWRLAYRFGGRQRELAIGPYPAVSLAEARFAREDAKRKIREGTDPGEERRLARLARSVTAGNTFKAIGDEFIEKMRREGRAPSTLKKTGWILRDLIYPRIGGRPIADVTALELLEALRRIENRGRHETAVRARGLCGQVFRYAIATGRASRDLSLDLRGALTRPQRTNRAAILDAPGIGQLLRAIDGYEGHASTLYALRFAPLVFVRPFELRHAEWSEFDLGNGTWRVPAEKMKMRRPHIVPLSRQALEVVESIHRINGDSPYLFPSIRSVLRPISDNTINAALRRMGYGKEEMCGHGFRRMASTHLNEAGFSSDWVERQLAHAEADEVRAAYNAAEYLPQRREMMQRWADMLDEWKSLKS